MIVVLAIVAAGVIAGVLGGLTVAHWPQAAPDAPRLTVSRVRHAVRSHRHLAAVLHRDVDPARATTLVLAAGMALFVASAAAVGILLLAATTDAVTGRTDGPLADWAARNASEPATDVVRTVSLLGGTVGVVILSVVVAVVEYRRRPTWAIPVLLLVVVGGQSAIVALAKAVIDRARPDVLQLTGFAGASFPSGHATAAAGTFACFALLLGRGRSRRARAVLTGVAVGVAVAVAGTRVALGVHWFTDVTAGLLLGWGWFALCSMAVGGHALRFGEPVRVAEQVTRTEG